MAAVINLLLHTSYTETFSGPACCYDYTNVNIYFLTYPLMCQVAVCLNAKPQHCSCCSSSTAHHPPEPQQQCSHTLQHSQHTIQTGQLCPAGPLHPPTTQRAIYTQVHPNTMTACKSTAHYCFTSEKQKQLHLVFSKITIGHRSVDIVINM